MDRKNPTPAASTELTLDSHPPRSEENIGRLTSRSSEILPKARIRISSTFGRWYSRLTLTQRFAVVSFVILLLGMLIIGWWVTRQIEQAVLNRTAAVTASFVSSAVAPQVALRGDQLVIDEEAKSSLDLLLIETELGQRIVSFKIWSMVGEILFSPDRSLVGTHFELRADLLSALGGRPVSKISSLDEPENEFERVRFTELQETYAPLRELGSGKIIGAVEFYERTAPLRKELWEARLQSWMIVIGATVAMYVLLLGMVGTASRTISRQRTKLARSEAQHEIDRMKAEFTSAISHEFRTPLGFIKGYSTTLLRDDISVEPETRREFLQIISDESDKLNRMFSDLLDASRIQAERFDVDRREVVLSQLLEEVTAKARPKVLESRFKLEVSISIDGVRANVDPDRVEQGVHNLIENACQYSNAGTVIGVRATSSGQEATISVRDHGDGIPAEETERVFEAFYRGENARRRRTAGTGLGLAVCRTIVEAHGGTITARNAPDAGAIISFTLPVLS